MTGKCAFGVKIKLFFVYDICRQGTGLCNAL